MFIEIISKLASESLLSLYPVFVKNIGLSLSLQTWSRCFSYAIISGFFIDYSFVWKTIGSYNGIMLSLVTILHIYTSYKGFSLLESGVAYSIFYLYPIMILLMSGKKMKSILLLALLGVALLSYENGNTEKGTKKGTKKTDETFVSNIGMQKENKNTDRILGVIMILLAAFTEAIIYFLVRNIKTKNNWNHIFISYFLGAIILTAYIFVPLDNDNNGKNGKNGNDTKTNDTPFRIENAQWQQLPLLIYAHKVGVNDKRCKIQINTRVTISLIINAIIGLLGYLLRFFAISRLDTVIYAPLSYFGIVMAFLYGVVINGDAIHFHKIVGASFIVFVNIFGI